MKVAWSEGKRIGYILGDGGYKMVQIFPEIALNDYGVFVDTGEKEEAVKQAVTKLSQAALQSGQVTLLDVIKVLKADSLTEAEHVLEQGIQTMQQQVQMQQQAQMQAQEQAAQAEQMKMQHEMQVKAMDNETKIEAAKINAESRIQSSKIESMARRDISDSQLKNSLNEISLQADYKEQEDKREKGKSGPAEKKKTKPEKKQKTE